MSDKDRQRIAELEHQLALVKAIKAELQKRLDEVEEVLTDCGHTDESARIAAISVLSKEVKS